MQENVVRAIDSQEFDWQGILEIGETTETLHYKFAGELVLAILLPNIPAAKREARIIEILKTAGELTAALRVIDLIFILDVSEGQGRRLDHSKNTDSRSQETKKNSNPILPER